MADETKIAREPDAPVAVPPFRRDGGTVSPEFTAAVRAEVEAGAAGRLTALLAGLHEADVADLIQALEPDLRPRLVELLGDEFDFTALTEVDEQVRTTIIEELPSGVVAEGLAELDSDDAVYILEDLDEADRERILSQIPLGDRAKLTRSLEYPEESAGRRMQTEFVAVPVFWTVGQTIDYMRVAKELPESFYGIFVVDPGFRLVGTVALDRLLRSPRATRMADIMSETRHLVRATQDQEEVSRLFERYNLVSAAVVDDAERLVGVLTVDDILDVVQQEADEDIRRLAGVGDEELSNSVFSASRSRLPWLLVNSITAFAAAGVIGLFDGSIEQMVALAVLMPIVASMGGNTGSQAMTVTVRGIATRELSRRRTRFTILREIAIGVLNGIVIALLVGAAAAFWFASPEIGGVIAVALLFNMLVAGLAGVTIPLILDRMGIDPAIASAVFVTAVTDVVGFLVFLGLAAWWFGLF